MTSDGIPAKRRHIAAHSAQQRALRAMDGLTTMTPVPGAAVVYGNGTHIEGGRYDGQLDAVHIGIVLRVEPVLLSIEWNTTIEGESRNGWIQTLKEVNRAHVLTYILPGDRSPC